MRGRFWCLGVVNVPDEPLLREEVFAHQLQCVDRSIEVNGRREVRMAAKVEPKEQVKARLGRSPDRADAFVLALVPVRVNRWDAW